MGGVVQRGTIATGLSQAEYEETPYADASWEVVGEPPSMLEFEPLELSIVPRSTTRVDPMFADFNQSEAVSEGSLWHCPTGSQRKGKNSEAETEVAGIPEAEVQAREEAAYQRGKEETIAEAATKYSEHMLAANERLRQLMEDVSSQHAAMLAEYEKQAVELAIAVTEKLFGTVVETRPEYITEVVQTALQSVGGAAIRKIRVSPEDFEFIQMEGIAQKLKDFDGTWHFEADDSVRAGCILESSAGHVDMQLDVAWERIKERVLKVVR